MAVPIPTLTAREPTPTPPSDPIGVLAHLQLARALSLSGEKAKSQTAYNEFFDRWKEAEPDIPFLKRARAESADLK